MCHRNWGIFWLLRDLYSVILVHIGDIFVNIGDTSKVQAISIGRYLTAQQLSWQKSKQSCSEEVRLSTSSPSSPQNCKKFYSHLM